MKIEKMIPWPSENAGSMVQLAHWSSAEEHVNIWELENCGHLSEDNIGWCMICMWERTGIRMGRMGRMATPKAVQNGEGKGSKGSTCNWGNNDHILRDASKVREINVGDLFFIKGNGFPTGEKGLVHKSPPVQYHPDGFVKNRLVLKVDVPLQWNQWEPVALKEDKEGWILSSFSAAVCVDVYSQAVSKLF